MKPSHRHYTGLDQLCLGIDQALRAVFGKANTTQRVYPGIHESEPTLSTPERTHAAGLMRINHTGEVCAQALYHAQGLTSRRTDIKAHLHQAAIEEGDHLAWCNTRLVELGSHRSYLNPLWYAGSFAIGLTAGLIGDKWNLGFVAETEQQVIQHLQSHLESLPSHDAKSAAILKQMQEDETKHRDHAIEVGAANLPPVIKKIMRFMSKVMVKTTYHL